jgi:hypothetical protein
VWGSASRRMQYSFAEAEIEDEQPIQSVQRSFRLLWDRGLSRRLH